MTCTIAGNGWVLGQIWDGGKRERKKELLVRQWGKVVEMIEIISYVLYYTHTKHDMVDGLHG